jgi:hypothetical protein
VHGHADGTPSEELRYDSAKARHCLKMGGTGKELASTRMSTPDKVTPSLGSLSSTLFVAHEGIRKRPG